MPSSRFCDFSPGSQRVRVVLSGLLGLSVMEDLFYGAPVIRKT